MQAYNNNITYKIFHQLYLLIQFKIYNNKKIKIIQAILSSIIKI